MGTLLPKQARRVSHHGALYLVQGKDGSRPVWHYVLVEKVKLPLFQRALKQGNLDVSLYGDVLFSGWGVAPPAEIIESINNIS